MECILTTLIDMKITVQHMAFVATSVVKSKFLAQWNLEISNQS